MPMLNDAIGQQLNQFPPWMGATASGTLGLVGQAASLPDQAISAITHPLYRTMLSGTPFDVSTVRTAHPWIAQHLPAFAGLDVQTGQPRWDVQAMQRYVANPLAGAVATAGGAELQARTLEAVGQIAQRLDQIRRYREELERLRLNPELEDIRRRVMERIGAQHAQER